MSEKSDRFFSDSRLGPDADAAVRPMRAGDSQCAPHRKGRAHCPEAIANAIRTEDQEGSPHTVERTHVLADDGWEQQQPLGS